MLSSLTKLQVFDICCFSIFLLFRKYYYLWRLNLQSLFFDNKLFLHAVGTADTPTQRRFYHLKVAR